MKSRRLVRRQYSEIYACWLKNTSKYHFFLKFKEKGLMCILFQAWERVAQIANGPVPPATSSLMTLNSLACVSSSAHHRRILRAEQDRAFSLRNKLW